MSKIVSLKLYKDLKYLEKDVKNKGEICNILKSTIKNLTKYDDYSSIKRTLNDLHVLYIDTKRSRMKNIEHIERLRHEQEGMDCD